MDSQLETFLNALGEAERAGGRVLHELAGLTRSQELKELLKKVGHDEGYWAGELAANLRRLGGSPSNKTGDFVEKVRAVADYKDKLELLNRGQRWVIRKIEEQLPTLSDEQLKAMLSVMAKAHEINIAAVDDAIAAGLR
jgi:Domain of unknown function (DUF6306)